MNNNPNPNPQNPDTTPSKAPDRQQPPRPGDPVPPPDQPDIAPPAEPVRKPPQYARSWPQTGVKSLYAGHIQQAKGGSEISEGGQF
jgi:hypothetical protein